MCKTIQHFFISDKRRNGRPVFLLIKEEASLLSIFHINGVTDTVLVDFSSSGASRVKQVRFKEAFIFFHTLQATNLHIVTLVQTTNFLSHLTHNLYQQVKEHFLTHFNAQGQGLSYKNIIEAGGDL